MAGHADSTNFVLLREAVDRLERRSAETIISAEGIVETWQPVLRDIFGYTAEEAIGKSLSSLIIPESMRNDHENGLKRWREATNNAAAVVACSRFQTQGLRKDGSIIPVIVDVQIVRDHEQIRFLGWITYSEQYRGEIR